jgi:uncharacterized NAD(P)/FAD-binding protein YdhS
MLSRQQQAARRSERAPAHRQRPTVAILGAGASGMLVATHLLAAATAGGTELRAVLIDRNERTGGAAYAAADPAHRLNVTAARMSAFVDDPDHFVRWRGERHGVCDPGAYAPRVDYREYLADVLSEAQSQAAPNVRLARLVAEVRAVRQHRDQMRLELADGGSLEADAVVLAPGNLPAVAPASAQAVRHHPRFVRDPWELGALDRFEDRGGGVALLVGTGLTMVDVALTLAARDPQLRLHAVSRSGLLPRAHLAGRVGPCPQAAPLAGDASLPQIVDEVLADSRSGGTRWHELVDGVRAHTPELWQRLSLEQRAEFIATRHRRWSVHRHRMAPEVAQRLEALLASGQLTVAGASPVLAPGSGSRLQVELDRGESFNAAFVVNCTGPGVDPRTAGAPLVHQLLESGQVRAHSLGLGFDTAAGGTFRSRDGALHPRLFTLGPTRFGELYETTAMPEICAQATALAATLAAVPETGELAARLSA